MKTLNELATTYAVRIDGYENPSIYTDNFDVTFAWTDEDGLVFESSFDKDTECTLDSNGTVVIEDNSGRMTMLAFYSEVPATN